MNTVMLIHFRSGRFKWEVLGAMCEPLKDTTPSKNAQWAEKSGGLYLSQGLGAPAVFPESWLLTGTIPKLPSVLSNQPVPILEITALVFDSGNPESVGITGVIHLNK